MAAPRQPADGDHHRQQWTSRRKRNRTDLTVEQKHRICMYHNEHPTATAKQLVDFFREEWGVVVGRSTIAATIGNKARWLSISEQKAKSKRTRTGRHEQMEQCLYGWYMDQRAAGVYVAREQLFARAKEIGRAIGIPETFTYSKGWLQKFQMRYNFRVTAQKSKTDAATKRFVVLKRRQMDRDLETTVPTDIFCLGEFRLCYRLMLRQSLMASGEADAVSVCLCTNLTGCRRLAPLVIGNTVTCGFSNKFFVDKLALYRYGAHGVLTNAIFSEWLYALDGAMRQEQRTILLLVGATSCNVERTYKLSNVRLRLLDTIGARNPFDHGLRAAFKIAYRRLQVQHLLSEGCPQANTAVPDLRDAIYLIRESWRQLPNEAIVGAWRAAGVVPEYRLAATHTAGDGAPVSTTAGGKPPHPQQRQQQQQVMPPLPGHPVQSYLHVPLAGEHPGQRHPAYHHQQAEHEQQDHQQPEHDQLPDQGYRPPIPPPSQPPAQQFVAGVHQLPVVGTLDTTVSQLSPFGLSQNGATYMLGEQAVEHPQPGGSRTLPDAGQMNLAGMRLLREELSRLPIPAAELVTVETLLAADDLCASESTAGAASFVRPPEHVTQTVARWAIDVLLTYLEQRDADLAPIDQLLEIRRVWVLDKRRQDGPPDSKPTFR
ncbi:Protein PDC2 [Amphibalanus amphitrite]|uniref:Protein PDC2 n=2 Tax=Amphibalanus amphitrite TaxID=1232801 RepID=A0A6A4VYL5_AMPAM|nr:Protein PDC2 [Amphibalanus amphitrite]